MLTLLPLCVIGQERIPMTQEKSGIYTVPCEVNGLKLKFVFDTGAADVHLSIVEAAFMLKNGYIELDDFMGTDTYSMADGSIAENSIVMLKSIKIGTKTIKNVKACISSNLDASLLLGQSAINRLGKYTIDGSYLLLYSAPTNTVATSTSFNGPVIYDKKGNVMPANYTGKGKKIFSDGSYSEAKFKNGLEEGYGKYYYSDGSLCYEGMFANGEYHGKGKRTYIDGRIYDGTFVNGKIEGYGTFTWPDGDIYKGNFSKGYRSGQGVYYWQSGERYDGQWVEGERTGKGTYYYSNGMIYNGFFVKGKKDGYGTFTWPEGDKYVGNFSQNFKEGQGTYYYKNGDRYEGEWTKGEQTGKGKYYASDGGIYSGDFVEGYFEGYGTYTYPSGNKYEGQWSKGERTGQGNFYYTDGDKYFGEYVKGIKEGYGTYVWKDGASYKGYWKDDFQNGYGTYYYPSGRTKSGTWKDGNYIGPSTNTSSSSTVPILGPQHTLTPKTKVQTKQLVINNSNFSSKGEGNHDIADNDDETDDDEEDDNQGFTLTGDYDFYLAQASTDLNLREGPGTDYNVVTRIPKGEFVLLTTADAGEDYIRVLYINNNDFGYVSRNYLKNFSKVEENASGQLQIEEATYKATSDIKIENRTDRKTTITLGSKTYKFAPHEIRTITDINPGTYKLMVSTPNVRPYISTECVKGGYEYSWVFFIKTIRIH